MGSPTDMIINQDEFRKFCEDVDCSLDDPRVLNRFLEIKILEDLLGNKDEGVEDGADES